MIKFVDFILIEGKVDDLEKAHPDIPVRQYADKDKTPTKKFLPWLVKQHKAGNVTPDHPKLQQTLDNFDKTKSKHGISDHTGHPFDHVASAVNDHVGTSKTEKKEKAVEGAEKIHDEDGISAHHIKTKEASQQLYGGGEERGGEKGGTRGTSWCVSARSKDCRFGEYGKMYTIHDKNDSNAPYAVHPYRGTITSRHNDGDKKIENVLKEKPHLEKAIGKIENHKTEEEKQKHVEMRKASNPNATKEDIDKGLSHYDRDVNTAAVTNKNATKEHLDKALTSKHPLIRLLAIKHPNITKEHINKALNDEDRNVREDAISHPDVTKEDIGKALNDEEFSVRKAAIKHPNATKEDIDKALDDKHHYVRKAALSHPNVTKEHIDKALDDKHLDVRETAISHPNVTKEHIDKAWKDKEPSIRKIADRRIKEIMKKKKINEDGVAMIGGTPTNNAGGGVIAGIGTGPQPEPGVKKGQKKKIMPFKSFITRETP